MLPNPYSVRRGKENLVESNCFEKYNGFTEFFNEAICYFIIPGKN